MAEDRVKISEMQSVTFVSGTEEVPLGVTGGNRKASLAFLRGYFKDSNLCVFEEFDNSSVTLVNGTASEEDGADLSIVYLTQRKIFALRKTITGFTPTYYSEFMGKDGYMDDGKVRTDRVFFCVSDKVLYIYNGSDLFDMFDSIRINAMTEEEFENLENPIEGAFYATYEE